MVQRAIILILTLLISRATLHLPPGEMIRNCARHIESTTLTVEATEELHLAVVCNPSANATIARIHSATATIIDNDAPTGVPVVTINDFVVDEASKEATFVITLNKPSTSVVSMNYATQNGAALAGSDFTATSGSLNFAPGKLPRRSRSPC